MRLLLCFVFYPLYFYVQGLKNFELLSIRLILCLGQITQSPNYSCYENNSTVTFTLSSSDQSAQRASVNCFLSTCNVSSSNNSSCLSSFTPCFDYRSWNNTSYCAPAIDCSILTPCDNVTNQCASNTSVCITNSCCSPQAVCLPLFATEICTSNPGILNTTGGLL